MKTIIKKETLDKIVKRLGIIFLLVVVLVAIGGGVLFAISRDQYALRGEDPTLFICIGNGLNVAPNSSLDEAGAKAFAEKCKNEIGTTKVYIIKGVTATLN